MHWKDRLPHELGDVKDTPDGFSIAVPIPLDDAGYFGRACPACERLFKMLHVEYEALPDDLELTCPYCGERQDHSEFLTADQLERMCSAGSAAAEQYMHDAVGEMLQRTFGRSANRSRGSLLEWSYRPGNPPMPRRLYEYVEERSAGRLAAAGALPTPPCMALQHFAQCAVPVRRSRRSRRRSPPSVLHLPFPASFPRISGSRLGLPGCSISMPSRQSRKW